MKKTLSLVFVLLLALSLLAACSGTGGGSDEKNGDNGNGGSTAADLGNGKISLDNDSIYYAIVDGVKYDIHTTVQDILNDGYTVSSTENMSQVIDPNKKFSDTYLRKDGDTHFAVKPGNRTDKPITKTECTIFSISLFRDWYENVSIIGDLTIGSSREEVEEIFGPGYGGKRDVFGEEHRRAFIFEYDDSGVVKNIVLDCNF